MRPSVLLALPLLGCPAPSPQACTSGDAPQVSIGNGVGGAFAPFEEGAPVTLSVAPQGGFGVAIVVETQDLQAGDDVPAQVRMAVEIDGTNAGEFTLPREELTCRDDGSAGFLSGITVGFDRNLYGTNDQLLTLDGQQAVLIVEVTDELDNVGTGRATVTLQVGG